MRALVAATLFIGLMAAPATQDRVHFLPADVVSIRDMSKIPSTEPAPGVHLHTVIGATGSMSLCEFGPGAASSRHHHTREQVDVGVTGTVDMTLGAHVEKIGPGSGVIVPPDVEHLIANPGNALMTLIEFHPVRRPDLVPPLPAITFAQSPNPVSVPDGRTLVAKLDQPSGGSVDAPRTIRGETCALTWRPLPRRVTPPEIQATAVEVFIYVVRGDADLGHVPLPQRVSPGTLVLVPARQRVTLQAVGPADAAIVEFRPAR